MRLPRFSVRATYWLIGINILVFGVDMITGHFVTAYGALIPVLVLRYRQWWRLISAGFLHADIVHIAFNLYALQGLGRLMERFFGFRRFLVTYGLSLLGCSALVTLFSNLRTPTVGASGAIMGVLGAMVIFFWKYRDLLIGGRNFLNQLARMALINIGIGLLPGISWWGHLGGFVTGLAIGAALLPKYRVPSRLTDQLEIQPLRGQNWAGVAAVLVSELVLLAVAFIWRS
jgi:rhomboid protease GluP